MKKHNRFGAHKLNIMYLFIRYTIAFAVGLSIASCVTPPLKTEQKRDRLAEAVGFEPDDIAFMNYCIFEEIRESGSGKKLKGHRGIVAVTESELCLVDGVLRKTPKNYFLKIPLSEIVGVSSSNGLMQIKHQDRLIVLFLYHWNDLVADRDLTQELYQSLVLANVPGFETEERYSFTRLQAPPELVPFNDREEPHDPYRFPDQYPHGNKYR